MEKEVDANSHALVRVLKFLAKKNQATQNEIREKCKITEYQFNHFLDVQKIIVDAWTPESDSDVSKIKYELTSGGYALYLNHDGLKEARLSSASARKWSIIAITVSAALSLYFSFQSDRQSKTWESHETQLLEEIRDAIKNQ